MTSDVVAFAGPCLPAVPGASWRRLLDRVRVRPPARRGDLLAAVAERPRALVLLDGYYYDVPAVTHKEILYALEAGVRVIGAASLGALRAAELEAFGMEGAGRVFRWYRDGAVTGDDEVALWHLPAEHGFRPLTVALVEVRHALARLARRLPLEPGAADRLLDALRVLPFMERRPERVLGLAAEILGAAAASCLGRALAARSVKQSDARLALRAALRSAAAPAAPARQEAPTSLFSGFRESYMRLPPSAPGAPSGLLLAQAWHAVQVLHPEAPGLLRRLRRRFLLASSAVRAGLSPDPEEVARIAGALRDLSCAPCGSPPLPERELGDEARDQALARRAVACFGTAEAALEELAGSLGLGARNAEEKLLALVTAEQEAMRPWLPLRAFALSPLLAAAARVAEEALPVFQEFQRSHPDLRIARRDLIGLAASLWKCEPEQVPAAAAARGLWASHGTGPGLYAALELFAPAERASPAGYRQQKARLLATALTTPGPLSIP